MKVFNVWVKVGHSPRYVLRDTVKAHDAVEAERKARFRFGPNIRVA